MSSLRAAPPRPATSQVAPAYPRLIAALALVVAGCGGVVDNEARESAKPDQGPVVDASPSTPLWPAGTSPGYDAGTPDTEPDSPQIPPPDPGGVVDAPFDEDATPAPTESGTEAGDSIPEPSPDGFADFPFDGGSAPDDRGEGGGL